MEKNLIQTVTEDDFEIGLYLVPSEVSQEKFKEEITRFDSQDEFDEKNCIDVKRIFTNDTWVI